LRGRSGASLAFYNTVLDGAAQQNPQNPVFEGAPARNLETASFQNSFESLRSLGCEAVRPQKPDFSGVAASAAPPSTVL